MILVEATAYGYTKDGTQPWVTKYRGTWRCGRRQVFVMLDSKDRTYTASVIAEDYYFWLRTKCSRRDVGRIAVV